MTRFAGFFLITVSAAGFGTLAISGRYAYGDVLDALNKGWSGLENQR
jgi:hypothetical protein